MARLNGLERAVLEKFLTDKDLSALMSRVDLDAVKVAKRSLTGVGFFADFERNEALHVFGDMRSVRWGKVGARLNAERIETGYLVYVDKGYLTGLEGYTYGGQEWPDEITDVEVYDLKE